MCSHLFLPELFTFTCGERPHGLGGRGRRNAKGEECVIVGVGDVKNIESFLFVM